MTTMLIRSSKARFSNETSVSNNRKRLSLVNDVFFFPQQEIISQNVGGLTIFHMNDTGCIYHS